MSSQGQETWDPWAAVSPHRSPATTDKEPTCAAWAMWCSPSCPGNFNSHLQPPEALLRWPSEGWTPGSRNHGKESLHRGQLTLQLSTWCLFAKTSYWMWILFGTRFCLLSHYVSEPQISSSANINLPQVPQRRDSQMPPEKGYLMWLQTFESFTLLIQGNVHKHIYSK